MRVLVIGGTNFIGPHVLANLHRHGHEVTVYHRGVHEPDLPPEVRHIHSESLTGDDNLRRTIAWEQANPLESGDPDPQMYAAENPALFAAHRGVT